jgi:AraC-like DNA-binding protein
MSIAYTQGNSATSTFGQGRRPISQTQFQSDTFPDVSVLGQMLGWDLGFRQLDAGDAAIPASAVLGEHVVVTHLHLQRRYHQLGKPPSGQFSFGVPLSPMRDWFGRPYEAGSILPFHLADGIDGISDRNFEAMTFTVSNALVRDVAEACRLDPPDHLLNPKSGASLAPSTSVQALRRQLIGIITTQGRGLDRDAQEALAIALLESASSVSRRRNSGSPSERHRALARALALLDGRRGEALTVTALCRATGVSLRTLNRAFHERFGIGPKAYLTRQRLSDLRDDLLVAPPETRIADLANNHGFWHLGQLAKVYRATFGELPSETLHSARVAASRRWA